MMFSHLVFGAGAPGDSASHFTGVASQYTHVSSVPAGIADSKLMTISMFLLVNSLAASGNLNIVHAYNTVGQFKFKVDIDSTGLLTIGGRDSVGNVIQLQTNSGAITPGVYHNIQGSWDTRSNQDANRHLYIDDSPVNSNGFATFDSVIAQYTQTFNWFIPNSLNGCLSELYINTDEYLDLSISSNRRKFIDSAIKPVDLGDDGSAPTGNQPAFYARNGNLSVNTGYSDNFNEVGTIGQCTTTPG